MYTTPTFAVIGHPNEGKSSVVSTLTENDRIMITSTPGETRKSQSFSIEVDGRTILRFIDTPGFQHPAKILKWFVKYQEEKNSLRGALETFITAHKDNRAFHHDVELLTPLVEGAAVIFVVDASHPMRRHDKTEMEILRLTGCPRMALINSKEDSIYLDDWKSELSRHYNVIREFNACHSSFAERIALIEALKVMHQEWEKSLSEAIELLQANWQARLLKTADEICSMLEKISHHKESAQFDKEKKSKEDLKKSLQERYTGKVAKIEARCHKSIRKLFRHDVFNAKLESEVVFGKNDLFSADTWRVLGLSRMQLTTAATLAGAGSGAAVDIALPGITFGVFSGGGALIGGLSAFFGANKLSNVRIGRKALSLKLGGEKLQLGPLKNNSQLIYILIDRALLYFDIVSRWSHAHRENTPYTIEMNQSYSWLTRNWQTDERKAVTKYLRGKKNRDEICGILTAKMNETADE